jgi:predicted Zn-dependent peptidase
LKPKKKHPQTTPKPPAAKSRGRFVARPRRIASEVKRIHPDEIARVDVKTKVYDNGLRVISEKVEGASSLCVGLWVRAGSRHESLRQHGIAHFIEHVVFKGTAGRTMREIMRSIEARGGFLNAFTTKEHTCYYTWTRTLHLDESVALLFDLALRPTFSEQDITREKSVIIEEINGIEDEPDELVFDLFEEEIFGRHPLAHTIIGTPESIHRMTRRSLAAFHRKHYRSRDLVIVASGSHEHEALFAAVDRAMRHVPPHVSRRLLEPFKFPRHPQSELHFPRASGQQAHLILGRRAPGVRSERHLAITALITLLGVGMSSRLNLRLREELGLAYDSVAFYSPFEDAGAIGLYAATAIENRERAIREMRHIMRGLATRPVSNAELERTKEQMIGSLVLPMESISNRMMRAAQNELYFGKYNSVEHDIQEVAALPLERVRSEVGRLFADEDKFTLVTVVPEQEEE